MGSMYGFKYIFSDHKCRIKTTAVYFEKELLLLIQLLEHYNILNNKVKNTVGMKRLMFLKCG